MWRWVRRVGRGRGIRNGELKAGDDSGSGSPLGTEDAARVLLGFRGQGCFRISIKGVIWRCRDGKISIQNIMIYNIITADVIVIIYAVAIVSMEPVQAAYILPRSKGSQRLL